MDYATLAAAWQNCFDVLPMIVHKLDGEKAFCGIYDEDGKAIGEWFNIKNLEIVEN